MFHDRLEEEAKSSIEDGLNGNSACRRTVPGESESWEWQGEHYFLQRDSNLDMSECVWNDLTHNEEDISYILEETTPIKACGDFPYYLDDCEMMAKTPEECEEQPSQVKRRRVLDFNDDCEDISSSFLKSKERIDAIDEILPEMSEWEACLQEDMSTSGFEDLGQSEAWLADCLNDTEINISFNDTEINISSDDGKSSATSDVQIGIREVRKTPPDSRPNMIQRTVRSSRNVIFKGRKSYMRTPTKLASSVAYPFDIIKPSGVRGDVTLKDINERIHTPPPSKSKQLDEDQAVGYPTSAFSGKPVIGKTKIPTQGGKGSITIMRTKG